ncbi:MAG: hypothetical protein KIS85_09385 [Anaerolineales bacterium]|nr:hypothetical protein [Anaerolineales bacterium]
MTISLDLESFLITSTLVLAFFGLYALWTGRTRMRQAGELPYHRLRQQRLLQGWGTVFWGLVLFGLAALVHFYGRPAAYAIIPVTPTASLTNSPTLSPTPSDTPTITLTPSETATLEFTLTPTPPQLPPEVRSQFESQVTPDPDAVFSPLIFGRGFNFQTFQPLNTGITFANPVNGIYAAYSYDFMLPGVQWSAVWYRGDELVYFETAPWNGGTGGFGYTQWLPDAEDWLPGVYQVQIFVGTQVKAVGEFEVTGAAVTSTPTPSPSFTASPTRTPTATHTRFPTATSPPP